MIGASVLDPRTGRRYFYYECTRLRNRDGRVFGAKVRRARADALEPHVWGFVSGLLLEPDRLRSGLQAMIEKEEGSGRGDPRRELELWHEKLREAERMRSGYQDLAARGLLTHEELGGKLAALEETRETACRELEALRGRKEELERLKGDRDAILETYADLTVGALDVLLPEQRNRLYKMLKLNVVLRDAGTPEVSGALRGSLRIAGDEVSCTGNDIPAALSV